MCGITGFIQKNSAIDETIIKKMNDKIIHRGPDAEGYLFSSSNLVNDREDCKNYIKSNQNFSFAHRRLSIQDLSDAGHQPMNYKNRYWIVYNGEIYNFFELKEELISFGYEFVSNTDTEIIMAAYDKWGTKCLNKFNGMWSFVLYDMFEEKFFISRDRFGIKPLYYYKDKEIFIFSSEIKSILEHPSVEIQENKVYLDSYLKFGPKEYKKETAFKDIYRFNFASFFEGTFDDILNTFKETVFWEIKPNTSIVKFNKDRAADYAEKYYKLLEDSVKIRLRADVKVGSALSGGLDSSSIVYLVNKILKEEGNEELQETFSSVYSTPGTEHCDESKFINELAKFLNVHSNKIEPFEKDVTREHQKVIYAMENPPESTCMSAWHTFKLVATTNVKVTLDGQGADEQLAGYSRYTKNYFLSLTFIDLFKETFSFLKMPFPKRTIFASFLVGLLKNIIGIKLTKFLISDVFKKKYPFQSLNEQLASDCHSSLVTLIHYADHTSMAHSIESRMPFMDYRLVEFLLSIPSCYKMHNGWTKYIARLAFQDKLPTSIVWRKDKMGWLVPEDYWFRGNLKDWLFKEISKYNSVNNLKKKFNDKNYKINYFIRYLNISMLKKIFFEKEKNESD